MPEDKKEVKKVEVPTATTKEELTKEELTILAQLVAQGQTQVQNAPRLIELVNKLGRMAKA